MTEELTPTEKSSIPKKPKNRMFSFFSKEKISENVKKESEKIIEYILNLDSEKLYKLEIDSKIFCGKYPFLFFIEYTKLYKGKIELINHILSSEINKDEKNIVSYASLLSYK